ncbi:hypothetical protein [Nannocystis bainbridge]|uniref:Neutral/alkaline non-lysosomal ceramidase N-terminal domain-containing protein n=1 Tax=Nannocystis bainbridge TaxID=2995303 RepID=A0ABT5E603_9BACT|nr:hypothetical protein [Nannocystis bainbridge]MDC0720196.1 hypothetical protein [Nannocystis bainbridge]
MKQQLWWWRAFAALALAGCPGSAAETSATDASSTSDATAATGSSTDVTPTSSGAPPTTSSGTTASTTEEIDPLPQGPIQAGVAVGYLTGPVGASMAGYGGRTVTNNTPWNHLLNGASGFYGLGTIKAMVIEVGGERLVVMKMPTMSSEHSLTEGAIEKLKADHGIDITGRLITAATHSHHNLARYWRLPAPLGFVGGDSPDEELIDRMTTAMADVIAAAVADLAPAQWGATWLDDWDPDDAVYRDRRGENDPTYGKDARLTLLAVRRPDGTPMATVINFGMHGTVFDSPNELFTEDAAGGLEMKFEEAFFAAKGQPIFGMFAQSGGGDASPAGDGLGHPEPARIERIGHAAAPRILALYDAIEWRDEATLGVRSRRIDLTYSGMGYDDYPEFQNAQGGPYLWGAWQCKGAEADVDDGNPATSLEGKPKNCMPMQGLLESLGETVPHGEVHQTYLTVARLDDFYMLTLPGEPTASVIQYARTAYEDRAVDGMVFGYSQDHLLYLTQPDDWLQGGYESEMSLWGPLLAKYLVDGQMTEVEALIAGDGSPVWSEQSPSLSVGKSFEPRALEAGVDAPGLTAEPPPTIWRGETLRAAWNGGEPGLGEPRVTVQVDDGGGFVDVASPSGWAGAALDNSRYHMLTHYAPDPKPNGKLLAERQQKWFVDWQVPADLPAGTYRLRIDGRAFDGQATEDYALTTAPFEVAFAPEHALSAVLAGGQLTLDVTRPPPAYVMDDKWPVGGFRLLDPEVAADAPVHLRVPLTLSFTKDDLPVGDTHEVPYVSGIGHVFDFATAGLDPDGLVARVHLRDDVVPAFIEAPILGP